MAKKEINRLKVVLAEKKRTNILSQFLADDDRFVNGCQLLCHRTLNQNCTCRRKIPQNLRDEDETLLQFYAIAVNKM